MSDDQYTRPISGEEAEKVRAMLREWNTFSETDLSVLSKLAWVIRNWRLFALAAIIGAAGSLKNVLEMMKGWLS